MYYMLYHTIDFPKLVLASVPKSLPSHHLLIAIQMRLISYATGVFKMASRCPYFLKTTPHHNRDGTVSTWAKQILSPNMQQAYRVACAGILKSETIRQLF